MTSIARQSSGADRSDICYTTVNQQLVKIGSVVNLVKVVFVISIVLNCDELRAREIILLLIGAQ